MIGNSDLHGPDLNRRTQADEHRTMTLVFVKERTLEGLKDALEAGRTAVWFEGQMIGRREYLQPLLAASIKIHKPHLRTSGAVFVRVRNECAMDIRLQRLGTRGPKEWTLPARTTTLLRVNTPKPNDEIKLEYEATDFLIAPETGLSLALTIPK